MGSNLVETLIGAVVIGVAAFFLYFAYEKAEVAAVSGYELVAKFEKIDGINIGSDVMLSGIKIGSVIGQELDTKNYLAVVRISVKEEVKLPEDSALKVTSSGLLGDQFLAIEPGGAEEMLAPGDEFQFTQGSIDIAELLGKAIYNSGSGEKK